MRHITALFAIFLSFNCFAQEYLINDDYVYGMGKTDEDALIALAATISSNIINESDYYLSEHEGKVSEDFHKNTKISASHIIKNAKQDYDGDMYYRYINKKEHIDRQISIYMSHRNYLDSIINFNPTEVKHVTNLILGACYLAYQALDDEIMNAFCSNEYEPEKRRLKEITYKITHSGGYYGYPTLNAKNWWGYDVYLSGPKTYDPYSMESVELFGFEYCETGSDEWKTPTNFYPHTFLRTDGLDNDYGNDKTRSCSIYAESSNIDYRMTYEYYKNGRYYKINVPDEWYYVCKVKNYRNF